jgi:hypothetical protein
MKTIDQATIAKINTDPQVGYNNRYTLSDRVDSREDHESLGAIFDHIFERDVERAEDQAEGGELPEGEMSDWRDEESGAWADTLGSDWREITVGQVRAILEVETIWSAAEVLDWGDENDGPNGAYFLFGGPEAKEQALRLVELAAAAGIVVQLEPLREYTASADEAFSELWQLPGA